MCLWIALASGRWLDRSGLSGVKGQRPPGLRGSALRGRSRSIASRGSLLAEQQREAARRPAGGADEEPGQMPFIIQRSNINNNMSA